MIGFEKIRISLNLSIEAIIECFSEWFTRSINQYFWVYFVVEKAIKVGHSDCIKVSVVWHRSAKSLEKHLGQNKGIGLRGESNTP